MSNPNMLPQEDHPCQTQAPITPERTSNLRTAALVGYGVSSLPVMTELFTHMNVPEHVENVGRLGFFVSSATLLASYIKETRSQ